MEPPEIVVPEVIDERDILFEAAGFSITGGGRHVYLVNKFVEY